MTSIRLNPAQEETVNRLVAGHTVEGTGHQLVVTDAIDLFVKSYEMSKHPGTKEINIHRAVRPLSSEVNDQRSYRFEMFRVDEHGKIRRL